MGTGHERRRKKFHTGQEVYAVYRDKTLLRLSISKGRISRTEQPKYNDSVMYYLLSTTHPFHADNLFETLEDAKGFVIGAYNDLIKEIERKAEPSIFELRQDDLEEKKFVCPFAEGAKEPKESQG